MDYASIWMMKTELGFEIEKIVLTSVTDYHELVFVDEGNLLEIGGVCNLIATFEILAFEGVFVETEQVDIILAARHHDYGLFRFEV